VKERSGVWFLATDGSVGSWGMLFCQGLRLCALKYLAFLLLGGHVFSLGFISF